MNRFFVICFLLMYLDVVDCIQEMGISVLVTNTIMNSIEDKKRLAQDVIEFAGDMMI